MNEDMGLIIMIIHVVQQGETIDSIAQMYGIDEDRLIKENGLADQNKLAVGQTILIVHAKQVHTVKEGDTLQSIADQYGITLIQLLRNNSYLLDREFIYPGEMIVIDFEDEKITKIATNGYVFPYVEPKILEKNLLYMTYLSIYSYTISSNGKLNDIDDANIISMAKSYGVAPIMVISNIKEADYEDKELAHNILNNQEIKNNLIENALSVLKKKGYYAVNVNIPYVQTADINLFIEFTLEFAERLHKEGFKAFITITPKTFELHPGKVHEEVDYSRIGQNIDGLVLISYDWAYPSDISAETIPFYYVKNLVEIFSSKISPEKIFIGYTTIGYIYEMPYIEGDSKARA